MGRKLQGSGLIKFHFPISKIPQQVGGVECGYYVFLYAKLFIELAPWRFSITSVIPELINENRFTQDTFEEFRRSLQLGDDGQSRSQVTCDDGSADKEGKLGSKATKEKHKCEGKQVRKPKPTTTNARVYYCHGCLD